MFVPLNVKTDYSLLKSLIKIDDLIQFLKNNNFTSCAILDDNLNGSYEFYKKCISNNIKPIIGLDLLIENLHIYVYAKDENSFKKLLKLNTYIQVNEINIDQIDFDSFKIILPYESISLFSKMKSSYLSYKNNEEKSKCLEITKNIVYVNEILYFNETDSKYFNYLTLINEGKTVKDYKNNAYNNYFNLNINEEDSVTTTNFINDINITINTNNRYIPTFKNKLNDSKKYLEILCNKGLNKRYHNDVPVNAQDRLNYELDIINKMGFVDYFLIVYDFVLYAKKNHILVGPGRGSAVGSLVSYSLGITDINPLDYNLLFERFLNPERVSMPDIDIDFDSEKRDLIINYVKEKYGEGNVAPIIAYGTFASKQALIDTAKLFEINKDIISKFTKEIDSSLSLLDNSKNSIIKKFVSNYPKLKEVYKVAMKLENLKKHVSVHAAGIIISSNKIDDILPIYYNNDIPISGYTKDYLEDLGLLKMDFLSVSYLTFIDKVLKDIKLIKGIDININDIDLEDKNVYKLFISSNTDGIFQFNSSIMKKLISRLKPSSFNDLIASLALIRPGVTNYIDNYINRKNGTEKVTYIDDSLKDILDYSYGIILYQEQIMLILVKMAGYSLAEADIVRSKMKKKDSSILEDEKDKFINRSIANNYSEEQAKKVFEMICNFAKFGFNKSHSVAYAYFSYQMAYLKTYYYDIYMANMLNDSIGNSYKTKEYIMELRKNNIEFLLPDVNESLNEYKIINNKIILPLSIIKGINNNIANIIINERQEKKYSDFCDFVLRTYKLGINKEIIENMVKSSCFACFNINKNTLLMNIDNVINYAKLVDDLDENLVMKPELEIYDELDDDILRENERECLGFYLSSHPTAKYNNIYKINKIKDYFDKIIDMVVLVEKVTKIKTKNNDDMAFVSISDETGEIDMTIFSNNIELLSKIEKGTLINIVGKVVKRIDKYNINLIKIKDIK